MHDQPSQDAQPKARADVVFRRVGEDWLLFDPRSREIHVLNLSAALVWSFCDGTRGEAEIAAEVLGAFLEGERGEPGESEADEVRALVDGFRSKGLLERTGQGAEGES